MLNRPEPAPAPILAACVATGEKPDTYRTQIRRWREAGQSWDNIVDDLRVHYGIRISRRTVAAWAPDPEGFTPPVKFGAPRRHPTLSARELDYIERLARRLRDTAQRNPVATWPHVSAHMLAAADGLTQIVVAPVPSLPPGDDREHPPTGLRVGAPNSDDENVA